MKRLTGFINGFIACLLMVYSFIIFVLYKWARSEDICGFEIKQRYSTNRPKYNIPARYSYIPPTYESRSEEFSKARDIDIRVLKIRFTSEELANEAKDWLIEQLESYKYVSAYAYFSHNLKIHLNELTRSYDHEYGWDSELINEIESTEPERLDDNCWCLALPPVSYVITLLLERSKKWQT